MFLITKLISVSNSIQMHKTCNFMFPFAVIYSMDVGTSNRDSSLPHRFVSSTACSMLSYRSKTIQLLELNYLIRVGN